jgi:hypothetical protein
VAQVLRDGVLVAAGDDRRAIGADLDRVIRSIWEG